MKTHIQKSCFNMAKSCIKLALVVGVQIASTTALLSLPNDAHAQTNPVIMQQTYSEAQLAQMLAPIALYPDSLLTHILIAATYPLEVVQAKRFLDKHNGKDIQKLMAKAEDQDWDPSVLALLAFPTVLDKMNEDIDWTQNLGDAFLQDEAQVMASIQSLRHQADRANSLDGIDNMEVTRSNNQIIIEAARPEIIYVPYYDPRTVYGHWRWYSYPPIYWAPYPGYARYPSHHSHFYWNTGVSISFNFYFSSFHWHQRYVVVNRHHKHYNYRYPSHKKFVANSGSQRWQHDNKHRRGVAYSTPVVSQKYRSNKPSKQETRYQVSKERYSATNNHGTNDHKSRQYIDKSNSSQQKVQKSREQHFSENLHQLNATNTTKTSRSSPQVRTTEPYRENKNHKPSTYDSYQAAKPKEASKRDQSKRELSKSEPRQQRDTAKQGSQTSSHQDRKNQDARQQHTKTKERQ